MRIVPGSGGSFLCPPGHPNHFQHIEHGPSANPDLVASLDYALANEHGDVPKTIQARVRAIFDANPPKMSELWVRMVYAYFRNCYSPDGVNRKAGACIIDRTNARPAEHHLAYLLVREYFPDHEPRLDLIADARGGYGQRPCAKCGRALQYEAKVDAFAEPITARLECPEGGQHERKED